MACNTKVWLIMLVLLAVVLKEQYCVEGESQVPCFFIFGDSLSDSGNNNDLITSAKVNYPPYGIDFPNGPIGRFTNGRTAVDIIAELLGFKNRIPPFARIDGTNILKGVNYASGASGIRDESGQQLGARISLRLQLRNHAVIVSNIARRQGNAVSTQEYLSKCLYYVGIGSNDYLNNYFMPMYYVTSRLYNPDQYAHLLVQQYNQQLRILYQLGARKFALNGMGVIGCTPFAMSLKRSLTCVEEMNAAAVIFNKKLQSLVDQLNHELLDAKFIYINATGMAIAGPQPDGIKVLTMGCCKVGENGQCIPNQTPCPNRNEYAFWDSFHPTEPLNKNTGKRSYKAQHPSDAYPMDISHLVQFNYT